jgi:hypothetical protein
MGPAQEREVVQVGRAAVQPVPQMMSLTPFQGPITAREDTATVAHGQGGALGGGDDPGGASEVQGLGGGSTQDRGQQGRRQLEPARQTQVVIGVVAAGVVVAAVVVGCRGPGGGEGSGGG